MIRQHRQRADEPATKGALRGLLVLGTLCVIIGLGLIVSDVQSRARDAQFRSCLAEIVTEQNTVLDLRGDFAERESRANQNLWKALFERSEDEADARKAYAAYVKELNEITQGRKENPIPDLPSGVCE